MAVNILDVDPDNLKFEFEGEWTKFRDSRIAKFLALWLNKELHDLRTKLEHVTADDLGKAQGAVQQTRKFLTLVERPYATEALKEVLTYLEKK